MLRPTAAHLLVSLLQRCEDGDSQKRALGKQMMAAELCEPLVVKNEYGVLLLIVMLLGYFTTASVLLLGIMEQ